MSAHTVLVLDNGVVAVEIVPALGGGLARFDLVSDGPREPLFRPAPAGVEWHPFDLGCNVLVPWSNRVSRGGFDFEGKSYVLSPNLSGEAAPIHGNGFMSAWTVLSHAADVVKLGLNAYGPGPYRYAACLQYALVGHSLSVRLEVSNAGEVALPFGLGLHPWLVRTPDTRLIAPANAVWLEDESHLPRGDAPVALPGEWDFRRAAQLPQSFVNNGFAGWNSKAIVEWPQRGLTLEIRADGELDTYILYSPSAAADFFCLEPVSHPVDAYHLPGGPLTHGMRRLSPGESWAVNVDFIVHREADRGPS